MSNYRSLRGEMFLHMRAHIKDVYNFSAKASSGLPNILFLELLTDVAGIVREKTNFQQYMNICYRINRNSHNYWLEILSTQNYKLKDALNHIQEIFVTVSCYEHQPQVFYLNMTIYLYRYIFFLQRIIYHANLLHNSFIYKVSAFDCLRYYVLIVFCSLTQS